jgi:hypothetical protein
VSEKSSLRSQKINTGLKIPVIPKLDKGDSCKQDLLPQTRTMLQKSEPVRSVSYPRQGLIRARELETFKQAKEEERQRNIDQSLTTEKAHQLISSNSISLFDGKGYFKQNDIKDFLDGWMPRGGKSKMLRTRTEIETEIVQTCNWLHHGQKTISDSETRYFLHFTEKYAVLKCSCLSSGKECLFKYWFKFKRMANSCSSTGEEFYDFELFRLINSNHSLPLH